MITGVRAAKPSNNMPNARQVTFELLAVCPETRARTPGILHTAHGDIPTPLFMPVGTQATSKGTDPARPLGGFAHSDHPVQHLPPLSAPTGHEVIRQLWQPAPVHVVTDAILTDSGGFQVFSLSGLRKITEASVTFSIAPEWRYPSLHAGIHGGCPVGARQRHHDGAR